MNRRSTCDRNQQSQRGSALMMTIIVFLVLMTLIGSLSTVALANYKQQAKSSTYTSAYYVAEAGLNESMSRIEADASANPDSYYTTDLAQIVTAINNLFARSNTYTYDNIMGKTAVATVTSVKSVSNGVSISVEGTVGSSSRTLSKIIRINPGSTPSDVKEELEYQVVSIPPAGISGGSVTIQSKVDGPLVTANKVVVSSSGTAVVNYPIITNNTVEIAGGTFNDAIVTNNNVKVTGYPNGNITVFLLPGATFTVTNDWFSSATIRLFVPSDSGCTSYSNCSLITNTPENTKSKIRIYQYDPDHFSSTVYPSDNPGFDYVVSHYDLTKFFESDYLLYNSEKLSTYAPKVVVPDYPQPVTASKWSGTSPKIGSYSIFDANGSVHIGPQYASGDINKETVVTLTKDIYIPELIASNLWEGTTLVFDIGDNNINMYVDAFKVTGRVVVRGTGTLNLYLKGNAKGSAANIKIEPYFLGAEKTGEHSNRHLLIYINEAYDYNTPLTVKTINSSSKGINANIIAENANLSAQDPYSGSFLTNGTSVVFANTGQNQTIEIVYAPYADISVNGGSISGSLVGKSVNIANSNITFTYDQQSDAWAEFASVISDPLYASSGLSTGGSGSEGGGSGSGDRSITFGPTVEGGS